MQATHIDMGLIQNTLIVHVIGRGTAEFCPNLDAHIKDYLQKKPITQVLFDAEEASYMDSSFIGIILSVKKRFSQPDSVCLLNPDDRIREIFQIMGLADFIPSIKMDGLHDQGTDVSVNQKLENTVSDMRLLLEAHQRIMETSDENAKRFEGVEKALKFQLDKSKKS